MSFFNQFSFSELLDMAMSKSLLYYLIIFALALVFGAISRFVIPWLNYRLIVLYDILDKSVDFKEVFDRHSDKKKRVHNVDYWKGKINGFAHMNDELNSIKDSLDGEFAYSPGLTRIFRRLFKDNACDLQRNLKLVAQDSRFLSSRLYFTVGRNTYEKNLGPLNYDQFVRDNASKRDISKPDYYFIHSPAAGEEIMNKLSEFATDLTIKGIHLDKQNNVLWWLNFGNSVFNLLLAAFLLVLNELVQDGLTQYLTQNEGNLPKILKALTMGVESYF